MLTANEACLDAEHQTGLSATSAHPPRHGAAASQQRREAARVRSTTTSGVCRRGVRRNGSRTAIRRSKLPTLERRGKADRERGRQRPRSPSTRIIVLASTRAVGVDRERRVPMRSSRPRPWTWLQVSGSYRMPNFTFGLFDLQHACSSAHVDSVGRPGRRPALTADEHGDHAARPTDQKGPSGGGKPAAIKCLSARDR